jgi:hypothetical protein
MTASRCPVSHAVLNIHDRLQIKRLAAFRAAAKQYRKSCDAGDGVTGGVNKPQVCERERQPCAAPPVAALASGTDARFKVPGCCLLVLDRWSPPKNQRAHISKELPNPPGSHLFVSYLLATVFKTYL